MYGTRNAETDQLARNGIEFIEAALKLVPGSPAYLNTDGLLIADGLGDRKLGLEILQKAAELAPDDIQIRQNIRDLQIGGSVPRALSPIPVPQRSQKKGDPSAALTHAVRQIQDRRVWLAKNLSYARRKSVRGGLGLFGVRSRLPAIILIGRRSDLKERDDNLRNQMCDDLGILIHTCDWVIPAIPARYQSA